MDIKLIETKELIGSSEKENAISISSSYVAISNGTNITVSALDVSKKEILLCGHTDTVDQLHFSARNILLSSSPDSLLSWNLDLARAAINAGNKPVSVYVGVGLGSVAYIATMKNTILLAVKCDIIVLDTSAATTRYLEGHTANVVFCEMMSDERILSLASDNDLKVWCMREKRAIAQFKLMASCPFTSIYFATDTLYLGSADGMLHIYEPYSGTRLKRLNVEGYLPSMERSMTPDSDIIHAQPPYLTQCNEVMEEIDNVIINNSVVSIFEIKNMTGVEENGEGFTSSTFPDLPPVFPNIERVLVIILTSGVIQLNSISLQLLTSTSFMHHTPELPLAYTVQYYVSREKTVCTYTDLFSSSISILELRKLDTNSKNDISMMQNCILTATTPLLSVSQWKAPAENIPVIKEKKKTKAKGSGYSVTHPKREMFKPGPGKRVKKQRPVKDPYVYPKVDCRPIHCKRRLVVSDRRSAVQSLAYSRDSQLLAAGLSDYSTMLLKLPAGNKSTPLIGHKGCLTSVSFNTTADQVITTASDKRGILWDTNSGESIVEVKYRDGNTKNCEKTEFKKDLVSAQFYYIDKFILLAHHRDLLLYKYHIEKPKSSKRLVGHYQGICKSTLRATITALSAVNNYFSNLVVSGLSDKSIVLYDYNQETTVLRIPDSHSRPPHHISNIEGSKYVSHTPETYNLLLSCSVSDTCKLWDARSGQCVRSFGKPCSIKTIPSISTCVRYVATPAEDQAVYMYDIRGGESVHKIQTEGALVSQFSPRFPQLAIGSNDGFVSFYNDS